MFLLRQVRLNLFYQILPLLNLFFASLYFEKVPRPKREGKVGGSHTGKVIVWPKRFANKGGRGREYKTIRVE